ncbi:hypothetical protein TNCV_3213961 [Trichonephila clavipes]|nr:hypothetical protein TNCV_3213961 [Trichonephila clavipes]
MATGSYMAPTYSRSQNRCFNPGEGMSVCKCIVTLRHGANIHPVTSSLVRLMEEEVRWDPLKTALGVSVEIGLEPSQIIVSPIW